MGKIYVAWDTTKPNLAKVGMTTREAFVRVAEAENPDYVLFTSYEVDNQILEQTEQDIHSFLEQYFNRRKHKSYGGISEWFEGTPKEVAEKCEDFLNQGTSVRELRDTIINLKQQILIVETNNRSLINENNALKEQHVKLEQKFVTLKKILRELSNFDGNTNDQLGSSTKSKIKDNLSNKSVKNALKVLRG